MEEQTSLPIDGGPLLNEPALATYTNYREYLRDYFDYRVSLYRNSFSSYTYKDFSAAADIRSPNYLKLIIDGERNLSQTTARKFAKALGLDKAGSEEFVALVNYSQALDPLERNRHLKTLNEIRLKGRIKRGEVSSEKNKGENIPRWVSFVLMALVDQAGADFSVEGIRRLLEGKVSADDIRKSLQQLFNSHALQLDAEGQVKKGLTSSASQEEIPADTVRRIQSELMYLGMESLLNGQPNEREIGTLTVCLNESEFEKLKFELRHLRKRILKDALIARDSSKGERVYQLNIQLFPITKKST